MTSFLNQKNISKQYKEGRLLWGLKPNRFVSKIPNLIKSGQVLDIGVGEGRNSLFLAQRGFNVTGIDISKEAINKFATLAQNKSLKVRAELKNVINFKFKKGYNLIICIATLHLIPKDKILEVIKKIKKNTKRNGINVITVFGDKDIGKREYPDLYFFDKNKLRKLYQDWHILESKEYLKKETHGKPHKHHIIGLIAKKPNRF